MKLFSFFLKCYCILYYFILFSAAVQLCRWRLWHTDGRTWRTTDGQNYDFQDRASIAASAVKIEPLRKKCLNSVVSKLAQLWLPSTHGYSQGAYSDRGRTLATEEMKKYATRRVLQRIPTRRTAATWPIRKMALACREELCRPCGSSHKCGHRRKHVH